MLPRRGRRVQLCLMRRLAVINGMEDDTENRPESLLPYDEWAEEALRGVAVRALAIRGRARACRAIIISTSASAQTTPGVTIPARLLAQYPEEMTIVLQHQYLGPQGRRDAPGSSRIGLSFGGMRQRAGDPVRRHLPPLPTPTCSSACASARRRRRWRPTTRTGAPSPDRVPQAPSVSRRRTPEPADGAAASGQPGRLPPQRKD